MFISKNLSNSSQIPCAISIFVFIFCGKNSIEHMFDFVNFYLFTLSNVLLIYLKICTKILPWIFLINRERIYEKNQYIMQ